MIKIVLYRYTWYTSYASLDYSHDLQRGIFIFVKYVFSVAGNVVNEKRSCLLVVNVDKLVFLFENHINSL